MLKKNDTKTPQKQNKKSWKVDYLLNIAMLKMSNIRVKLSSASYTLHTPHNFRNKFRTSAFRYSSEVQNNNNKWLLSIGQHFCWNCSPYIYISVLFCRYLAMCNNNNFMLAYDILCFIKLYCFSKNCFSFHNIEVHLSQ